MIVIYINNLETVPLCVNLQTTTTEATIFKFGSGVLYSIRMKMELSKVY